MLKARISHDSHQGGRSHQEDRVFISEMESGWLLAVMDGHGGEASAEICFRNIGEVFSKSLENRKNVNEAVIKSVFKELDVLTRAPVTSGSTLSAVFVSKRNHYAHIGILGDSPVIVRTKGTIYSSPEHNARTNIQDRNDATARGAVYRGGYLWKGERGLQLTRALGDSWADDFLNREPETYSLKLEQEGDFVLVASDGLLDPGHYKKELEPIVRMVTKGAKAENLVIDALQRETRDNVSAILLVVESIN